MQKLQVQIPELHVALEATAVAVARLVDANLRDPSPVIAAIAAVMDIDTVIHLIEAPGFLDNPEDESTLVERMSVNELKAREAAAEGRIKRKLLALTRLCADGKTRVIITDGRSEHPIEDALNGGGTHIQ